MRCSDVSSMLKCAPAKGCMVEEPCTSSGGYPHCAASGLGDFGCVHCDTSSNCVDDSQCAWMTCANGAAKCASADANCRVCPAVWDGHCEDHWYQYGVCSC